MLLLGNQHHQHRRRVDDVGRGGFGFRLVSGAISTGEPPDALTTIADWGGPLSSNLLTVFGPADTLLVASFQDAGKQQGVPPESETILTLWRVLEGPSDFGNYVIQTIDVGTTGCQGFYPDPLDVANISGSSSCPDSNVVGVLAGVTPIPLPGGLILMALALAALAGLRPRRLIRRGEVLS